MKITVISDTHMLHEELGVLSGDVLIHCGDMFNLFDRDDDDLARLDDWFGRQAFDLILCVGGNHDLALENARRKTPQPFANARYLEDAALTHDGVTFYGAPWVPYLMGHAFFQDPDGLRAKWALIPGDVDVLITHTPPAGILDVARSGEAFGCNALREAVPRIAPRLHCFGHVHASAGVLDIEPTTFVNATSVGRDPGTVRRPFEVEI